MKGLHVAPLVGAWIEISGMENHMDCHNLSLLSWERGLKSHFIASGFEEIDVAPLVGAWIEIEDIDLSVKDDVRRSSRGSVD